MKIKAAYKYIMYDMIKALLVYASIIVAVNLFTYLSAIWLFPQNGTAHLGGMEMASVIFLFVVGLNSFKENYRMLMQNSVSRKSVFNSTMLSFGTTAAITSVFSILMLLLSKLMNRFDFRIIGQGILEQIYSTHTSGISQFSLLGETLLFDFVMFLAALGIGYFITTLFYRLNKPAKIAVAVGVPVTMTIILPIVDTLVFGGRITISLVRFIDIAFGLSTHNPYAAIITFICTFIVTGAFSWLLTRKAAVKA